MIDENELLNKVNAKVDELVASCDGRDASAILSLAALRLAHGIYSKIGLPTSLNDVAAVIVMSAILDDPATVN